MSERPTYVVCKKEDVLRVSVRVPGSPAADTYAEDSHEGAAEELLRNLGLRVTVALIGLLDDAWRKLPETDSP